MQGLFFIPFAALAAACETDLHSTHNISSPE
jgi:hypothetical protein